MMGLLFFLGLLAFGSFVQSQTDFISLHCGTSEDYSYTDDTTQLSYISDAKFIDTGVPQKISSEADPQFSHLRSFPDGARNCYTIPASPGNKYLVRAWFMYGNYDGLNSLPTFDLYLGVNFWTSVDFGSVTLISWYDIITLTATDSLSVCLMNTNSGTPFISVLEIRPITDSIYDVVDGSTALLHYHRKNFGGPYVRFPDDKYDRTWSAWNCSGCQTISTSSSVDVSGTADEPSPAVMQTAAYPTNCSTNISFPWGSDADNGLLFMFYIHFAELQALSANQSRKYSIYLNGQQSYGPFSPKYLSATTIYSKPMNMNTNVLDMQCSVNSTLPPLLNALEIYTISSFTELPTVAGDVHAINNIKAAYDIQRNWVGDPCLPSNYSWDGLNCSRINKASPPSISLLNLSSSGLTGEISPYIADLTSLHTLDLSNNGLTGQIPDFLGEMSSLMFLNLSGNNFNGPIPTSIQDKINRGTLTLSVEDNAAVCGHQQSCRRSKKKIIIIVIVIMLLIMIASLSIVMVVVRRFNKRRQGVIVTQTEAHHGLETRSFLSIKESLHHGGSPQPEENRDREERRRVEPVAFPMVPFDEESSEHRRNEPRGRRRGATQLASIEETRSSSTGTELVLNRMAEVQAPNVLRLTYEQVKQITNGFDKLIGEGGFGRVFAGFLSDGTHVAVKMLRQSRQDQALPQFLNEVNVLMKVRHRNLVPFEGFCDEGDHKFLICKYMDGGDLSKYLSATGNNGRFLNWKERLEVALGSARGLEHLHVVVHTVHRDVKPENILLNERLEANIADFGLGVFFNDENITRILTNEVVGTPGYVDPEIPNTQTLSYRSDVYSFGVVLLQLIMGLPAVLEISPNHRMPIAQFVDTKPSIDDLVDPRLGTSYHRMSIEKALKTAKECTRSESVKRPDISKVVQKLEACLKIENARNS